jgi:AraC-like DNA-binding protein
MKIIPEKGIGTKKKLRVFFLLFPFLFVSFLFFINYKKPFFIINKNANTTSTHTNISLKPYDDQSLEGNSEIQLEQNSDTYTSYKYILRDGFAFPYVGVIYTKTDSSFFDLSEYDYLAIKIKAKAGIRIPVTLKSYIPDYSKPDRDLSYRNLQYILNITNHFTRIEVPLKDFETPEWWYTQNNKTEKDLGTPDLSKIQGILLSNCINLPKGKEDIVEVGEISFHKNYLPFYIYSTGFLFVYFALLGLFFFRKKTESKTEINFQYKETAIVDRLEKEEETVFGYLTTHYSNSELSIIDVQNAVGLHERKISAVIKNKTELNFKQFLNKLRITEAKRLLSDTDLQIAEIAFKVGYGNASHFNRVFKSSENCSPNDFRKDHSNSLQ